MCKAHVLRFSCAHGVLMSLEPCKLGPCPVIKTTGERLPQQPYRCYNCQHRRQSRNSRPTTADSSLTRTKTSCAPGATILDSEGMDSAAISPFRRAQSFPLTAPSVYHPLPGVAKQPSRSVQLQLTMTLNNSHSRRCSSSKTFKFTCHSSSSPSHLVPPHYLGLPSHLPHQDHGCPPCQLEALRKKGEEDAIRGARAEYPQLTEEMLIRGGCIKEWQSKPSWEQYAEEKVTEEREMWVHVTRKWTQDLKKCRVLVSEEDGLGLFP